MTVSSLPRSDSELVDLEKALYHKCARKLHFVSRAYFEQGLHVISTCRDLLGRVPTFNASQKEGALKVLQQTVDAFSEAVSSAAYVFIGHGRDTRVDGDFSVITIRLSSSLRAFSMPKTALEKALRLAKQNDAMKSKRMFVVQKQLIRNSGNKRRDYFKERFNAH